MITRTGKLVRDFPETRKATVTQPIFSGLAPAVLTKLRAALTLGKIFGSSMQDYKAAGWLNEFSYEVYYNQDHLLDIAFTQEGMGAYPDSQTKHFIFNLNSGETLKALDLFQEVNDLSKLVDSKLQSEIQQIISETGEEGKSVYERREPLKFKTEDLDNFSVSSKGVTFIFRRRIPTRHQGFSAVG